MYFYVTLLKSKHYSNNINSSVESNIWPTPDIQQITGYPALEISRISGPTL